MYVYSVRVYMCMYYLQCVGVNLSTMMLDIILYELCFCVTVDTYPLPA